MKLQKSTILALIIISLSLFVRVYQLDINPPSMYWEEVALGYDAYSILKTGKDHHGNVMPIVSFESFGDFKPSGYFYAIVPFLLLFGLNVWAVRLPSAIAGVVMIWFIGLISEQLISNQDKKAKPTWFEAFFTPRNLSMFAAAISPWAIQFSRSGWEVNLATCFLTIGCYFGLRGAKSCHLSTAKPLTKYYLLSVCFLVLSAYTYHATRVIAPLMGFVLALPLFFHAKRFFRSITLIGFVGFLCMLPLLLFISDPSVSNRLQETSAFTSQKEVLESNQLIQQFGSNRLSKIIFHRYWFYAKTILSNTFSHFRLDYLFLSGDKNPRHSIQYFGIFFPTDSVLLVLGIVFLLRSWQKKYAVLFAWLCIGYLPASLTLAVPHALRTLPVLPVYMIILGVGYAQLYQIVLTKKFSKIMLSALSMVVFVQLFVFTHFYALAYPMLYASEWQYGYQQMIASIEKNKQLDEPTFITREYGRPAMYYWFFTKTDPQRVQVLEHMVSKDKSEFRSFENVAFPDSLTGQEQGLIASSLKLRELFTDAKDIEVISDQLGKPVWVIYRTK